MSARSWSGIFRRFLFFGILILGLASCSLQSRKDAGSSFVWPPAPDIPRIKYETVLGWADDLARPEEFDALKRFATGGTVGGTSILLKPYDVAARGGRIVVSDTLASVVHVWDVRRRSLFPIGWRREGRLQKPLGIAIDQRQQIYVVDGGQNRVVKFDHLGLFMGFIGEPERFSRLSDVSVAPDGSVYLLDRGGVDSEWHRIAVYSADGEFRKYIGERGNAAGQFNHPSQLAVDDQGDVYVLDAGNFRVQVFDGAGKWLRQWGKAGRAAGDFARPRGLALSPQGHVLVSDSAFQNVQIFSAQGELLMAVGSWKDGNSPGEYLLPAGIACDESGRIYIVDQALRRLEVLRFLSEQERASGF